MRLPLLFRRPKNPFAYLVWWIPYVLVYQVTNRFPLWEPRELAYSTIDQLVPFTPWLMPIYLLYLPLYWWTAIRSETDEIATRLLYASYLQLLICVFVFVLFPVRMPEGIGFGTTSAGWAAEFWNWFDGPNNCLPSLHAANGLLLVHFNWNRPYRWIHTAVGLGVVASTVFVKQHYVVDVAAGAAVYLLTVAFLAKLQLRGPGQITVTDRTYPASVSPVA